MMHIKKGTQICAIFFGDEIVPSLIYNSIGGRGLGQTCQGAEELSGLNLDS